MTKTHISEAGTDFQSIILNLQLYWAKQGAVILQPYDMEVGAGTFHPATTLRALGLTRSGAQPMFSHRAAQPMGVMVKTRTGYSIIISFRRFSNHHLLTRRRYILALCVPSVLILMRMISALSRMIGSRQHWARGDLAGKYGVTVWKCRNSPISSRLAALNVIRCHWN